MTFLKGALVIFWRLSAQRMPFPPTCDNWMPSDAPDFHDADATTSCTTCEISDVTRGSPTFLLASGFHEAEAGG